MKPTNAVGVPLKIIVQFETEELKDYNDVFIVENEDGFKLEVPLFAYTSKAIIAFEPFVNFGFIPVG